jgi:Ca2+-binding RTX toxin-like protein
MSVELIAAFNDATNEFEALAAINTYADELELSAASLAALEALPNGEGREKAIGLGVNEIKTLFGEFDTVAEIKTAVEKQIAVEHAKHLFINYVKDARTQDELKTFLKDHLTLLNNHRQALIEDWSDAEDNPAVAARVVELKADTYTIWLEQLTDRLNADISDQFLNDLCTYFVVNRGSGDYFGVYPLLQNLDRAADEASAAATPDGLLADGSQVYLTQADEAGEITFTAASQSLWTDPDVLKVGTGLPASIKIAFDGPDFEGASTGRTTGVISEGGVVRFANPTRNTADFFKMVVGDETTPGADLEAGNQVSFVYVINANDTYTIYVDANGNGNLDANDVGFVVDADIVNTVGIKPIGSDHFVDKFAPEAPTVALIYDTGTFGDEITNYGGLTVTDETDATVEYSIDDGQTWTTAFGAVEGENKVQVRQTDLAGNVSAPSSTFTFILDTTGPAAAAVALRNDTGIVGDNVTSRGALAITGIEAGARVEYSIDYNTWTTSFEAEEGLNTVHVRQTDAAGNISETTTISFTLNSAAPNIPSPLALAENADGRIATVEVAALNPELGETFTITGGADQDLFEIVEGKLLYIGGPLDFENVDGKKSFALTITVADAAGNLAEREVTVNLTNVNEAPVAVANGNSASGDEDTVITGGVPSGSDVDAGDSMKYELVAPVAGLTLNADGTFRYVPPADFNGVVEFQYRVVDASGAKSEAQTFKLTVNALNDAPRDITLSNASVVENSAAGTEIGKLTASDPEGGAFTFALLDNAGGRFTLDSTTGTIKVASNFALDYEQATSHTLKVQVKDSAGAAYEESFTINVGDVSGEKVTGTSTSDVLTGNAGKDVFKAGAGNDTVSGGSGNDTLYGGSGNDKVRGGIGKDTLKGETGKDTFVFDTKASKSNVDKILDFKVKDDSFWLDNAVFTKLGKKGTEASPAKMKKSFFTIGDKAKDKNDYVVYDNKKGKLFYDADGSGKGKQVEIATLSKNLKMNEKDFFIV